MAGFRLKAAYYVWNPDQVLVSSSTKPHAGTAAKFRRSSNMCRKRLSSTTAVSMRSCSDRKPPRFNLNYTFIVEPARTGQSLFWRQSVHDSQQDEKQPSPRRNDAS